MRREDGRSVETTLRCAHARTFPTECATDRECGLASSEKTNAFLANDPLGEAYVRRGDRGSPASCRGSDTVDPSCRPCALRSCMLMDKEADEIRRGLAAYPRSSVTFCVVTYGCN